MFARGGRVLAALALACSCLSCAPAGTLRLASPPAGTPALTWPPVPIDAYDTADGIHHDLPGGYMIAQGDSVVLAPRPGAGRPAVIAWGPPPGPVTLHRDSVVAVFPRLEDDACDIVGPMLGGAVLTVLLATLTVAFAFNPYAWGS